MAHFPQRDNRNCRPRSPVSRLPPATRVSALPNFRCELLVASCEEPLPPTQER